MEYYAREKDSRELDKSDKFKKLGQKVFKPLLFASAEKIVTKTNGM